MALLASLLALNTMQSPNPNILAITILALSLLVSLTLFNSTLSSWLSFVIILTFSSGIITLFIYATSLSPNENSNPTNNNLSWALPLVILLTSPTLQTKSPNTSMNTFSNQTVLILATSVLILTIVTIILQGFNPHQTISSSY